MLRFRLGSVDKDVQSISVDRDCFIKGSLCPTLCVLKMLSVKIMIGGDMDIAILRVKKIIHS